MWFRYSSRISSFSNSSSISGRRASRAACAPSVRSRARDAVGEDVARELHGDRAEALLVRRPRGGCASAAPTTRGQVHAPCSRKRWSSTARNASGTCLGSDCERHQLALHGRQVGEGAARCGRAARARRRAGRTRRPSTSGQPPRPQRPHTTPASASAARPIRATTRPPGDIRRQAFPRRACAPSDTAARRGSGASGRRCGRL